MNLPDIRRLDPPCRNKPKWGHKDASLLVKLTYFWVFDLLKVSKKRQLVEDDIDEIDEPDSSKVLLEKFLQEWDKQLATNKENPSLSMTLIHTIGLSRFIFVISSFSFWIIGNLGNLTFLNQILIYFDDESKSDELYERTLYYCGAISIITIIVTLQMHWMWYTTTNMGVNIRQVLAAAILYKSLKISPNSVASSQVINLMSTDAQRFQFLFRRSPLLAVMPLLIPSVIYICYVVDAWYPVFGLALYFFMSVFFFCFLSLYLSLHQYKIPRFVI